MQPLLALPPLALLALQQLCAFPCPLRPVVALLLPIVALLLAVASVVVVLLSAVLLLLAVALPSAPLPRHLVGAIHAARIVGTDRPPR